MSRKTKINKITSPELIAQISKDNMDLINDFLGYLKSTQKRPSTIREYKYDLMIAFVWNLQYNDNKFFVKWTKRNVVAYQNYLLSNNENSPARVRRLKAVLSSLSNYIYNILDDEYPEFRPIINKIENPVLEPVREKSIFTEEEIDGLLDELTKQKQYRKACVVALAAFGGRRKSELCRFKVSDFDNDHLVCDGALYKSDLIETKGRGVNGKMIHCYTLAKKFKPYLDAWMKYREENEIESKWLFPDLNNFNEQMNASTITCWYDEFSDITGKDFYCHGLRHYFTTHLIRSGIPATVVKDIMSWQSLELVSVYDDSTAEESFGMYFGEEGIKKVERRNITEI